MMIPANLLRRLTSVALLAGLLLSVQAFAQLQKKHVPQITPKGKGKVDLRVDAINYWKKMQRLGYVTPNPVVKVQKAEITPPAKTHGSARFLDSPDVPVSLLSNTTQSENSIFINPQDVENALNSNNSTDWVSGYVGELYGANDLYTFDQGLTWLGELGGAGGDNSGDPTTAIGLNGYYYTNFINSAYGQSFAFSTDQGQNWQQVLIANAGGGGFAVLDKNHMWIDNRPTSPYVGNLYVAWTNFAGGANDSEIELCRSTNNGINWSNPMAISENVNAGSHNQGVNLQTGPNGEVYAVWAIYDAFPEDETALGFTISTNGGVSFQPATRIISNIRGIRMTETGKDMRVNSFPVMAVDISGGAYNGNIYIVWCNIGIPGTNTGNDKDVYLIKSTDGGATWSTPLRVNQDPPGLGKEHFFPWITCDPVTGTLSVIYYDDRNVTSDKCQAFVSVSTNGGDTWEDFKVSDVSFTPAPIGGLAGGYFGDYLGITARNRVVYPCWTDNRDGRAMTYVSPFTTAPPPNQPFIIYNTHSLTSIGKEKNTTMNYGDSLYMSLALENIGDEPATNVWATLRCHSPYITLTDSTEYYGSFAVPDTILIDQAFAFQVSDTIPDAYRVQFIVKATDGDSTWFSNFYVEAHAPALKIMNLTVSDPTGNNNGRLDPGESATIQISTSNTGDFDCPNTIGTLATTGEYLTILNTTYAFGILQPGQTRNALFDVVVSDEVSNGQYVTLQYTATSGLYHAEKTFVKTIGLIVEDWEYGNFSKFPWQFMGNTNWAITDVEPYEGVYSTRSGPISDNQTSSIYIDYDVMINDSISFFFKTSSEESYDFLTFYIDGMAMDQWSGEKPWQRAAFPVTAGAHTFRWEYSKDIYLYYGQDRVWTDFIVFPPMLLPTVNAGPDDVVCGNIPYQLNGEASDYDSLRWVTYGDGTFSAPTLLNPTYLPGTQDMINGSVRLQLIAYGSNGSSKNSMYLTVRPIPLGTLTGGGAVCAGDSLALVITVTNGSAPWTAQFNQSPQVYQIPSTPFTCYVKPLATGVWTVAVTDAYGCAGTLTGSASIEVKPSPGIDIVATPNDTVCAGQTILLYAGGTNVISYQWTPGGATASQIQVDTTTTGGLGTFVFHVSAINNAGCSQEESLSVTFRDCTGMTELISQIPVMIIPNPNNGRFFLKINNSQALDVAINITNIHDQIVWSAGKKLIGINHQQEIRADIPKGFYFLNIITDAGNSTVKFVVSE